MSDKLKIAEVELFLDNQIYDCMKGCYIMGEDGTSECTEVTSRIFFSPNGVYRRSCKNHLSCFCHLLPPFNQKKYKWTELTDDIEYFVPPAYPNHTIGRKI